MRSTTKALRTAAILLSALAMTVSLAACGGSSSASSQSVADSIGSMPSYLPKTSGTVKTVRGTTDKPALSYPGSPVLVKVGDGEVRVDIGGPSYPATGKTNDSAVPASFPATIANTAAKGGKTVSLDKAVFDVLDNAGATHVLIPTPALPKSLAPGQKVKVTLRTTTPSGEGLLRFRPDGGDSAAGWDFILEID